MANSCSHGCMQMKIGCGVRSYQIVNQVKSVELRLFL